MSKKSDNPIKRVKDSNVFFMPADALTSELHLAAFLDCPRRTVVDSLFHPKEGEGVPHVSLGSRKVFTVAAAMTTIEKLAKPQGRSRRGGAQCQKSPRSNNAE